MIHQKQPKEILPKRRRYCARLKCRQRVCRKHRTVIKRHSPRRIKRGYYRANGFTKETFISLKGVPLSYDCPEGFLDGKEMLRRIRKELNDNIFAELYSQMFN